ncbi:MAG: beta-lactamase family protein [Flavobacteriales bacterium]|nr:beta-lactamase family protein [Flavobacteriales bacterium]
MKTINTKTVLVLLLGFSISLSSCKKNKYSSEELIQMELDEAVEKNYDGAILCVHNAHETKLYTAGYKERDLQIPASADDLFKIASISKLYIAVACAKLINDGTLDKNKSVAEYLPHLADRIENSTDISLRMLIQHRSGIPNFTADSNYPWDEPFATVEETLEFSLDKPADFKPDKRRKYSNTNYLLIGEILNHELGYHHQTYIKSKILIPLNLQNTYGSMSQADTDKMMSGYFEGYEPDIKNNDFVAPGGSMVGTAEDVAIFLSALNEGTLLNDNEQSVYNSLYELEHTGLLPGYQSIARYHEDIQTSVVLFVNRSGENTWLRFERLYKRIVRHVKR